MNPLFFLICLLDWFLSKKRSFNLINDRWILEDFDEDHHQLSALTQEERKRGFKQFFKALTLKEEKEEPRTEIPKNDDFNNTKGNE